MANVVTKLIVDSQDYDNKIKRAAEGLQHYAEACKKAGGTLEYVDDEAMAFARDLGKMESVATNAKARMREYTDAIATATAMYRQMSDAEKQGDFGKALASSIAELKIKAADLKDVMADTNMEIKNLASDTSFTDGLNLMARTIGASASAIVAWTGDSKEMEAVIKDLAKIGTTVAAVDQLTKAFQKQNLVLLKNPYVAAAAAVVALGVAIGKLIQKSQELSAVDKALQDVQQKGRENSAQEITRIDTLNSILHDNTRSLEERKTALAEIQNLVPDYHGALTEEGNLINDNTGAIDDYIDSLQRAAIAQAAFDKMVELQKKKMEEQVKLQKAQKELERAQSMAAAPAPNVATGGAGAISMGGATAGVRQGEVRTAQNEVNSIQKVIDEQDAQINALRDLVKSNDIGTTGATKTTTGGTKITTGTKDLTPLQEAQRKITELSNEALTADDARVEVIRQEIASLQEQVAQYKKIQDYVQGINQDSEPQEMNPEMRGPEMSAFEKLQQSIRIKLADQNFEVDQASLTNLMTVAIQNGINGLDSAFEGLQYQLAEGLDIPDSAWQELADQINEQLANLGLDPIVLDVTTGGVQQAKAAAKGTADAWQNAVAAVNNVGSALQQIEDPAAKVSGIVMEAVANIALGFAQATASHATGAAGVFGWIAAATAGVATMVSTIAAIKSATSGSYASGGIIPGNSFSGDNLTANVNSGELILNRAQQASIAGQLSGGATQTVVVEGRISGKDILLSANNTNRAAGGSRGYYTKVK